MGRLNELARSHRCGGKRLRWKNRKQHLPLSRHPKNIINGLIPQGMNPESSGNTDQDSDSKSSASWVSLRLR